ncbi:5-oxoprolinase subunit PxpB [Flavobacteriaceae bacterium LMO-SS05]
MDTFQLTYRPFGERSILVEWPSNINENILHDIINFKLNLQNNYIKSKIEVISAYNSLLICYDYAIENINDEVSTLKAHYLSKKNLKQTTVTLWKIPVCYNDEFALDLMDISSIKKRSKSNVIKLYSNAIYTVYFIGFLPGFLYLGGLDKRLHFPRKSTPRLQIRSGAVAIGGNQTGIYPCDSPGGWNIIGHSPISFFDALKVNPCFAKAGDKVQFVPISIKEHHDISTLVEAGVYQMESEVIDG